MDRLIAWEPARRWAQGVLEAAGASPDHAAAISWGLCEAQAIGVTTHGLVRLLSYVETLRSGEVNPAPQPRLLETPAVLIDADGGYGFGPARELVDLLVERVRSTGIAFGGVRDSHHFGPASLYATRAAREGYVAVMMTNASANLAAPSGVRPVIGNNPLAIAVPGPRDLGPVCADIAMSQVALGKIRLAARRGESIPEGWARDRDGAPTTDPELAIEAGMLEPLGGHKGFALGVVVELLAGVLTGSPFGEDSAAHQHPAGGVGHFAIVMDPGALLDPSALVEGVAALAQQVGDASAGAERQLLPGFAEERRRREADASGLRVPADVVEMLAELGGLPPTREAS